MPRIIRAEVLGFCPGVRRALRLVEAAVHSGHRTATFGPLVHNRRVVADLEARGVEVLGPDIGGFSGTVVTRSHGIPSDTAVRLARDEVRLVSGTCPKVLRVQSIARRTAERAATLVMVGDPAHAEVESVVSYATRPVVIPSEAEATAAEITPPAVVVAQTTYGRDRFEGIVSVLLRRFPDLEVLDTVCTETDHRLGALRALAGRVDAIVVIGGRESSNTRRLYEAAAATGKPSYHVESAGELRAEVWEYATVGLTAGASTPDTVVDEVEARLSGRSEVEVTR